MKVLFSAVPEAGHLRPLFPLGRALADRGHEVLFATSPAFAARARAEGFRAVDSGDKFAAWTDDLARRVGGSPGGGLPPHEIERWFVAHLFAEVGAEHTLGGLLELVTNWRPHLVVHDAFLYSAPLAAAIAGIPHVAHGLGPLPSFDVFERSAEAVAPLWRRYGLHPPADGGIFETACLSVCPPSPDVTMPQHLAERLWPLRPTGGEVFGDGQPPSWLDALPARPTIYATLGTFLNTNRGVFRAILDGLADEDVNVVVTVGGNHDPSWLGPAPANAMVERYIPQSLLLHHCAAVINHGGSGTILGALAHAIPLLVVPQGADNFTNAARCAQAGVGVALQPGEVSAEAVRAAVRRLLDDSDLQRHCRRVAGEIAAMPSSEEVAQQLETLAAGAAAPSGR